MKFIKWLVMLFISCGIKSEIKSELKIEGIKATYSNNQNIQFSIINNEVSELYYYIGVEGFSDNHWSELVIDIDMPNSKSAKNRELGINSRAEHLVNFSKVLYQYKIYNHEKYRFIVSYTDSIVNGFNSRLNSESFTINKN